MSSRLERALPAYSMGFSDSPSAWAVLDLVIIRLTPVQIVVEIPYLARQSVDVKIRRTVGPTNSTNGTLDLARFGGINKPNQRREPIAQWVWLMRVAQPRFAVIARLYG